MTTPNPAKAPKWLLDEGASVIGTGTMGAAYTARLAKLGVPVTVFNRAATKAAELAKAHRGVRVAGTVAECAKATHTIVVACSPTPAAISFVCEQLTGVVRDRHVTFIVDSGLPQARLMEETLADKGKAATVTNVALFGTAYAVTDGTGAILNASGRAASADVVGERVLPLLQLFGAASYHPGGTAAAAYFAMAGHVAYMPVVYGLMHYVALMSKSGVGSQVALEYFQTTAGAMASGFAPMLAAAFEKRDYSVFFGSHQLLQDIEERLAETCKALNVDDRFARLMGDYHAKAMQEPALAGKSFQSAYEVIDRTHGWPGGQ
jgi:3-hydroxyisobutyrate dehydrogenase-like beta-hydroxyacid dehydrogenase